MPTLKNAVDTAEKQAKKAAKALADFEVAHPETPRSTQVNAQASKLIVASRKASAELDEAKEAVVKSQTARTLVARHGLELDPQDPKLSPLRAAQDGKVKPASMLEIHVLAAGKREVVIPLGDDLQPDFDNAVPNGWGSGEAGRLAGIEAVNQLRGAGRATVEKALDRIPLMDVQIVTAPLVRQLGETAIAASATCAAGSSDCGVLYRSPAPGRIRICWRPGGRDVSLDDCFRSLPTEKHVLYAEDRSVPQFGRLASLPFHNGSFANNTLTAEFAEDGRILNFGYKKPTAEVQAALASVNDGIGGITDLITYANGAKLRKLQEQKAINEAILGGQESRAKLTPTEIEQLTKQTALIDAQIGLAAAQVRQQPSQVTAIDNETLLIEAEIRKAQKVIELRKLQAQLAEQSPQTDNEN